MNESHELARVLLERAKGDQYIVERLANDLEAPSWTFGFHAQQAVEKALKSALCANSVAYPRTHNLAMLLELLRLKGLPLPPDAENLPELTPFGAALRYDDDDATSPMPDLDRAWAAECVARAVRWAEAALNPGTHTIG